MQIQIQGGEYMGFYNMKDHSMDGLDMALLISLGDDAIIGLLVGLLEENGIFHVKRDRGAGNYLRILAGNASAFGTDIYVKQKDFEAAKALADGFINAQFVPEPEEESAP